MESRAYESAGTALALLGERQARVLAATERGVIDLEQRGAQA